jgi:hypothetical protein
MENDGFLVWANACRFRRLTWRVGAKTGLAAPKEKHKSGPRKKKKKKRIMEGGMKNPILTVANCTDGAWYCFESCATTVFICLEGSDQAAQKDRTTRPLEYAGRATRSDADFIATTAMAGL